MVNACLSLFSRSISRLTSDFQTGNLVKALDVQVRSDPFVSMKSKPIHHTETTRASNLQLKWVLGRRANSLNSLRHTVTHTRAKNPLHTPAAVLPRDLSRLRTAFPTADNRGLCNIIIFAQMEKRQLILEKKF